MRVAKLEFNGSIWVLKGPNLLEASVMKINAVNFAIASALTAAIVWIICSLLVWTVPGGMMNATTNMVHMDMARTGWTISFMGIVLGLFA